MDGQTTDFPTAGTQESPTKAPLDQEASKDKSATMVLESGSASPTKSQVSHSDDGGSQKLPQDSRNFTEKVAYEWLNDLRNRVNNLEKVNDKVNINDSKEGSNDFMKHTRPEVRVCNWEQFKNRFGTEEDCCAIETLMSSDDLDGELEAEQWKRLSEKKKKEKYQGLREPPRKLGHGRPESRYLERVRINSAYVLGYLAKVTSEASWSEKPHTFLRPFKILVHFHEQMLKEYRLLQEDAPQATSATAEVYHEKEELQEMNTTGPISGYPVQESHEKHTIPETTPGDFATKGHQSHASASQDAGYNEIGSSHIKALEDMRCYIDFVKEKITVKHQMFENADSIRPKKVRFTELWSLFRVGELVFQRNNDADINEEDQNSPRANLRGPKLWRIYYIESDDLYWEVEDLNTDESGKFRRDVDLLPEAVKISAYYIDYDGDLYSGVREYWTIMYYPGEKYVTKLPIYPIRFVKDYQATLGQLQERGKMFHNILSRRHPTLTYQGWSMVQNPSGKMLQDIRGQILRIPRHIDSDIIVDFHEAFQTFPWWKPFFPKLAKNVFSPKAWTDHFPIIQWANKDRTSLINKHFEIVVQTDDVASLEWNQFLETDQFIVDQDERSLAPDVDHTKQELSPDDLALLPSRIFGYALKERAFYNLDIRFMKETPKMDDPFGSLRIDDACKNQIQALVYHHFKKKKAQEVAATKNRELLDQDFIRGKGRGLVILLHGAPGVGKTATAEAVSYSEKKPLFPITCGDLGLTPSQVEISLTEIFRLANLWDCILLLYEAEIFLSPREKRDENLQRNTLVSIFLRTLEYYRGILFLTTNRVGALDEAVKSRVHLSLGYPHLAEEETLALFKMNLERLERIEKERADLLEEQPMTIESEDIMKFASSHYRNQEQHFRWNGRQIRNAFQIASSLAHYQYKLKSHRGLYISAEHFREVEAATMKFDKFRQQTLGKTDDEIAMAGSYRAGTSLNPPPSRRPWNEGSSGNLPQHSPMTPRNVPSFSSHASRGMGMPAAQHSTETLRNTPPSAPRSQDPFLSANAPTVSLDSRDSRETNNPYHHGEYVSGGQRPLGPY
ncbi:hypothetical protein VM1G_02216 [Cytospora mali]|uniref:Uncharacterized protein n=1 Tax=Cytospora mali TaxID=578113 RepID=A0A194VT30_CYTMA|nr:hypothetical protein VM1G_02216 [Valsa mali]